MSSPAAVAEHPASNLEAELARLRALRTHAAGGDELGVLDAAIERLERALEAIWRR
ncbi:hypothetical protein [Baekduia soli]|uniref:hypothetical protein n=1 Tax=Baekduia soli TaxID=496014 RepID=UPI0016528DF2|nr:hypothetical protein [Baekduia soli]